MAIHSHFLSLVSECGGSGRRSNFVSTEAASTVELTGLHITVKSQERVVMETTPAHVLALLEEDMVVAKKEKTCQEAANKKRQGRTSSKGMHRE